MQACQRQKELIYIGAQHGMGPESNNSTFKMIRRAFGLPSVKAAIGESTNGAEMPSIKGDNRCKKEDFRRCGEHFFTASLASERNVPYQGAEPTDRTIVQNLKPKYSKSDFACFKWMVQVAGSTKKDFSVDNPDSEMRRKEFAEVIQRNLGIRYTYDDFTKCYAKKMSKPLNLENLSSEDFKPSNSNEATFFQRAMFEIDKTREPLIIETIKNALTKHGSVVVVYGSGHLDR